MTSQTNGGVGLPVRRVRRDTGRQLRLPLVTVRQELLFVVQQLLASLSGVLLVRRCIAGVSIYPTCSPEGVLTLNNGIDGARLLAETAVDTLGHVDIVSSRSTGAVLTFLSFNGDSLSWADLTKSQHQQQHHLMAVQLTASHSLQAMHRSSPVGYRLSACSPRKRGEMGPFSNGYMMVYGGLKNCSSTTYMPRNISVMRKYLPALSRALSPSSQAGARPRRGTRGVCGVACRVIALVEKLLAERIVLVEAMRGAVVGRRSPRARTAAMAVVVAVVGRSGDSGAEVTTRC
jgi:hypothetical protein